MPAVAVPAAVSLVGMAANAIGQHKQMSAQQKADAAKVALIQGTMDKNRAQSEEYRLAQMPSLQQLIANASAPQTTTSSGTSTTEGETSTDYGPEGNAVRSGVLLAAKNAPWEVNNLLAEQQAMLDRNISGQQRAQNTSIGNLAAKRGVDPSLMRIGADQAINNERLNQGLNLKQNAMNNRRQAFADQTSVLKNLFEIQKQKSKTKSNSTSTGPANYAAMLGGIQAMAPTPYEVATA